MQLCPSRIRRTVAATATAATLAGGLFFAAAPASAAPPVAPTPPTGPRVTVAPKTPVTTNPTNQQLTGADAAKAALDQQVGELGGQVAAAQARLDQLQRASELAEQRVALAVTEYRSALDAATRAQAAATAASKKVDAARIRFAQYMQATYMDGVPAGLAGNLLTAKDPNALLDQSSYQQYESAHNAGVIGQMQVLSVAQSNAHARAEQARRTAQQKQRAAEAAQRAAIDAVHAQQDQTAGLEASRDQAQNELVAATARRVQLYNNRADHNQYVTQLNAYNELVAYNNRVKAYRVDLHNYQVKVAAERARQIALAKAAAKARKKHHGGGGGSGGGSTYSPPRYDPPAPTGGGWTQAKGNQAVKRAKAYLGTMYAWAGGTANGPTYGVCAGDGAYNDCNIRGFDCSGLVMYAWHQDWAHYADTQYSQAGSYHPSSRSRLKPGDLLFFGYRGGGSDLHHVAMYVGHGDMIEAPQSGDVVQISSVYKYSDYYGATRPLT